MESAVHVGLLLRPKDTAKLLVDILAKNGDDPAGSEESASLRMARLIGQGKYADAFAEDMTTGLLGTGHPRDVCGSLRQRAEDFMAGNNNSLESRQDLMLVGAACLHCVVQANFTGPPSHAAATAADHHLSDEEEHQPWAASSDEARALLRVDDEDVVRPSQAPWQLLAARTLLEAACTGWKDEAQRLTVLGGCCAWWAYRACLVHQRLLKGSAASLRDDTLRHLAAAKQALKPVLAGESEWPALLAEECCGYMTFRCPLELELAHAAALEACGVAFRLGGKLAMRTRYQERALPQLALSILVRPDMWPLHSGSWAEDAADARLLEAVHVEDDVLLDDAPAAATSDPERAQAPTADGPADAAEWMEWAPQNPAPLVQALLIIAGEMARMRLWAHAGDSPEAAASDDAMVYVQAALAGAAPWAVRFSALQARARLDSAARRRRPRALAQLEVLDQGLRAESPPPGARLDENFWRVPVASVQEMKLRYGRALAGAGVLEEAVRAFIDAGSEEEAAMALAMAGDEAGALQLLRDALADPATRSADLLCALGDLTGEAERFVEALALAGGRHYRAVRGALPHEPPQLPSSPTLARPPQALALGSAASKRRDWAEAVGFLETAASIRPHTAGVWTHLALCRLRMTPPRTEAAISALQRAVNLDGDEPQAWALLGSALLGEAGRERESAYALGKACALSPDDHVLAGRHVRACTSAGAPDVVLAALQRSRARGLPLPQSALAAVHSFVRSGNGGEATAALAQAAGEACEQRLKASPGEADVMAMAAWCFQAAGSRNREAHWRIARLEGSVAVASKWDGAGHGEAVAALVEEAAQLYELLASMSSAEAIRQVHKLSKDLLQHHADDPSCRQPLEDLRMLLSAMRRDVADDDSSDEC